MLARQDGSNGVGLPAPVHAELRSSGLLWNRQLGANLTYRTSRVQGEGWPLSVQLGSWTQVSA